MKLLNVAYMRCSTDKQEIEHQKNSINLYCKAHNIIIDEWISDEGISAYSKTIHQRENFQTIIHYVEQKKLNALILFETSRLSRNFYEGQNLIKFFTDNMVEVHSVTDGGQINKDLMDGLLNSIRYFLAEKSSKETSDRWKSLLKMKKDRGEYCGGRMLWGFHVVDKKEVPKEEMKPIIENMFDWYINYGNKETMRLLTEHGYPISMHQILLQRLSNPKYIQVIGQAKFNQTQKIMQSRRCNKKSNTKSLNRSSILLEGLVYHCCEHNARLNIDRNAFRCRKCKGTNTTLKKSFSIKALTNNIEHEILNVLDNLDREKLEERYNSRCTKNISVLKFRISELQELIKSKQKTLDLAQAKLERYILENANDNMIQAVSNMIANVKSEINEIDTELEQNKQNLSSIINEEQHQEQMINQVLEIREIYKSANVDKKKAILNLLIDKIIVRDTDDFDIYLNI